MVYIRKLRSRNGNLQIQVVQKTGRQNKVVRHLGTARNELEVNELINLAEQFIENQRIKSGKISLFDNRYSLSGLYRLMEEISNLDFQSQLFPFCFLMSPPKVSPYT